MANCQEGITKMHQVGESVEREQQPAALLHSVYTHHIRDSVNYKTVNCIYYWKCKKTKCKEYPRCEYVGRTTRPFQTRLAEHKQYVRSQMLDKLSGHHFNSTMTQPIASQRTFSGACWEFRPLLSQSKRISSDSEMLLYNNGLNIEPWVWPSSAYQVIFHVRTENIMSCQ